MAVQLWLAERIAGAGGPRGGEVVFTFVGDEERLGPNGLAFLREEGVVRPDYLVLGAQTEFQAIAEERGVFWTRLTARGRAAHAGDPEAGDSAILRMTRLIETLQRELGPRLTVRRRGGRRSTMNIGTIRGGHNTNAVPSECVIEIDRRTLAEEKVADAFAEMEAALATSGEPAESYAFEFLTGTNGFASGRRRALHRRLPPRDRAGDGQASARAHRGGRERRALFRRRRDRNPDLRPRRGA